MFNPGCVFKDTPHLILNDNVCNYYQTEIE